MNDFDPPQEWTKAGDGTYVLDVEPKASKAVYLGTSIGGLKGWWFVDVWLGKIPLIKLTLALQVLTLAGVWFR